MNAIKIIAFDWIIGITKLFRGEIVEYLCSNTYTSILVWADRTVIQKPNWKMVFWAGQYHLCDRKTKLKKKLNITATVGEQQTFLFRSERENIRYLLIELSFIIFPYNFRTDLRKSLFTLALGSFQKFCNFWKTDQPIHNFKFHQCAQIIVHHIYDDWYYIRVTLWW